MPERAPPTIVLSPVDELQLSTRRIGEDRNPIVVIDNVLANAQELRQHALASRYVAGSRQRYYPGFGSPVGLPGLTELARWAAAHVWERCYQLPRHPFQNYEDVTGEAFFGVFAPAPGVRYSHVHADRHSWLALVLYLSDPPVEGGTAFWRDRASGLQSFLPNDLVAAQQIEQLFGVHTLEKLGRATSSSPLRQLGEVAELLFQERTLAAPFPAVSGPHWELLELVEMRFNRLVIYPTWQLHSIACPSYTPPARIEDARLTLNLFVEYPIGANRNRLPVSPVPGMRT